MYIKRSLEDKIVEISGQFPVLLVTGPRQSGKTTLLKHIAEKNRTYVSFDNPAVRELAIRDPELFFQQYEPPLLLDEIQYAPELFPFIKMIADRERRSGLFWLTGSQQFRMVKGV